MHNTLYGILGLIVPLFLAATIATAAPSAKAAEDRYIAARDAAIEKISAIYDAGNADDTARKDEGAASADLAAQMRAILNEPDRDGFGPAKLNIDTFPRATKASGRLMGCGSMRGSADQTQSDIPDAADTVFVSAIANGKVCVAYGSIDPKVQIPACIAIRSNINKKAEQAEDDLWSGKIDRKAYDKPGNLRQKCENEYMRCFTKNAPKQASFAEATLQAERLLATALNKRLADRPWRWRGSGAAPAARTNSA